jgi:hypothetical protein
LKRKLKTGMKTDASKRIEQNAEPEGGKVYLLFVDKTKDNALYS